MATPEHISVSIPSIAELLPLWLEKEGELKYEEASSVQRQLTQKAALNGGLERGKLAYQDFSNQFSRFGVRASQAESDDDVVQLLASLELGKFVSRGVELEVVLTTANKTPDSTELQSVENYITLPRVRNHCKKISRLPYSFSMDDIPQYWSDFEHDIVNVAESINAGDSDRSLLNARKLLNNQIDLFIAYTAFTGLLAKPEFQSSSSVQNLDWNVSF